MKCNRCRQRYALAPYTKNRLVAAVNARVELLELGAGEGEGAPAGLQCLAEHFGHVLALHVRTRGEFVLVGDLMRSMCVLRFDEVLRKLVLVARDTSTSQVSREKKRCGVLRRVQSG